ncbi:putative acyl-CoA synthetase [Lachnellula suecica]|uniref:Putative acyl-CoA synthetase n=1 Tax=Lachnellula suecica TaxID=602035 RepID=A0A8T9BWY4_9HELO|nr:putative acyl-CoA synthetase [Lachnellula suecica]
MGPSNNLSILIGPIEPPLWNLTLGQFLKQHAQTAPSSPCLVFPQAQYRATYKQLYDRTIPVAKGLIAAGVRNGDNIGILAGNCPPYVELLFATSHIGAALVVLNSTYTPLELHSALKLSGCRLLFTSSRIGKLSSHGVLNMLAEKTFPKPLHELQEVFLLKRENSWGFRDYDDLISIGERVQDTDVAKRTANVHPDDVCNLQFTSGTTGAPKAAMLTHNNILNNGRFTGDRMLLTPKDIVCCPPPLFHAFGITAGLLAALTHGSSIVFPSETFQPLESLQAVSTEGCTALHGVPAMFSAYLDSVNSGWDLSTLRTGIVGGSPVPPKMMADLRQVLNLVHITNLYGEMNSTKKLPKVDLTLLVGMTETSAASLMSFTDDPIEKRLSTVGKIFPHVRAKIGNTSGDIVPTGSRGELWVSGFGLQKGYWRNPEKTAEAMRTDENGILWMQSGDEAVFDSEGYCRITGRIKDIIIRGGESIYPLEIEERLVQHASIVQASVVGIADEKLGETVSAFIQQRKDQEQPSTEQVRAFARQTLGWHKVLLAEMGRVFS